MTGVFEFVFYLLHDVPCDYSHVVIVHHIRLDHYADFAARLDRIGFFNAFELVCDLFEFRETLDVVFEIFAPCSRTGGGNGIRSLDDESRDGLCLDVAVMGLDGVDDFFRLLELAGDFDAELYMGAFDFLGKRLSDVMQKAGALCDGI